MKLPLFNSPRQAFCTCFPKYNINTYLGRCAHQCVYCYAIKFPSFVGSSLPRLGLLDQIGDMSEKTRLKLPVMMSDCTDPYQPMEREHKITRRCAQVLAKHGFPLLVVTKSDMVIRDIDVFRRTPTVVAMTVTTPHREVAELIEPFAPPPEKRLSALQKIVAGGVIAVARIDPILPTLNDDEKDFESLVSTLAGIGVRQVTVSTMKHVRGFFSTLMETDPTVCQRLKQEYTTGTWVVGYKYLPTEKRRRMVEKLRPIVLKHGLAFASCREGLSEYNTTLCDGTAYCRHLLSSYVHGEKV